MNADILRLIYELEHDLADGYEQLNRLARIKFSKELFDVLVVQSRGHAEAIGEEIPRFAEPAFDIESVRAVQRHLKAKVFNDVLGEVDAVLVYDRLADTEHDVGRLYESIAIYCRRLGEHYAAVAAKMKRLAGDEYSHEAELRGTAKRTAAERAARLSEAAQAETDRAEAAAKKVEPTGTTPAEGAPDAKKA